MRTTLAIVLTLSFYTSFSQGPGGYVEGSAVNWNFNGRDHLYFRASGWAMDSGVVIRWYYGDGETSASGQNNTVMGSLLQDIGINWDGIIHMPNGRNYKVIVLGSYNNGSTASNYANDDATFYAAHPLIDTSVHARIWIGGLSGGPGRAHGFLFNNGSHNSPYRFIYGVGFWVSQTALWTAFTLSNIPVPRNYVWFGTSEPCCTGGTPKSASYQAYANYPGTAGVQKRIDSTAGGGHSNTTWADFMRINNFSGGNANTNRWIWGIDPAAGIGGGGSPVANAGIDQTITLPTSQVTVNGNGSTDAGGTITNYLWTKISGTGGTITNSTSVSTTITGLSAGTYVYQLQVTDNDANTNTDQMTVTVNSAPPATDSTTLYPGQYRTYRWKHTYIQGYVQADTLLPKAKVHVILDMADSCFQQKDSAYRVGRGLAKKIANGWPGKQVLTSGDTAYYYTFTFIRDTVGNTGANIAQGFNEMYEWVKTRFGNMVDLSITNRVHLTAMGYSVNFIAAYLDSFYKKNSSVPDTLRNKFGSFVFVDASDVSTLLRDTWWPQIPMNKAWFFYSTPGGNPYQTSYTREFYDSSAAHITSALRKKLFGVNASTYSNTTKDSAYASSGPTARKNLFRFLADESDGIPCTADSKLWVSPLPGYNMFDFSDATGQFEGNMYQGFDGTEDPKYGNPGTTTTAGNLTKGTPQSGSGGPRASGYLDHGFKTMIEFRRVNTQTPAAIYTTVSEVWLYPKSGTGTVRFYNGDSIYAYGPTDPERMLKMLWRPDSLATQFLLGSISWAAANAWVSVSLDTKLKNIYVVTDSAGEWSNMPIYGCQEGSPADSVLNRKRVQRPLTQTIGTGYVANVTQHMNYQSPFYNRRINEGIYYMDTDTAAGHLLGAHFFPNDMIGNSNAAWFRDSGRDAGGGGFAYHFPNGLCKKVTNVTGTEHYLMMDTASRQKSLNINNYKEAMWFFWQFTMYACDPQNKSDSTFMNINSGPKIVGLNYSDMIETGNELDAKYKIGYANPMQRVLQFNLVWDRLQGRYSMTRGGIKQADSTVRFVYGGSLENLEGILAQARLTQLIRTDGWMPYGMAEHIYFPSDTSLDSPHSTSNSRGDRPEMHDFNQVLTTTQERLDYVVGDTTVALILNETGSGPSLGCPTGCAITNNSNYGSPTFHNRQGTAYGADSSQGLNQMRIGLHLWFSPIINWSHYWYWAFEAAAEPLYAYQNFGSIANNGTRLDLWFAFDAMRARFGNYKASGTQVNSRRNITKFTGVHVSNADSNLNVIYWSDTSGYTLNYKLHVGTVSGAVSMNKYRHSTHAWVTSTLSVDGNGDVTIDTVNVEPLYITYSSSLTNQNPVANAGTDKTINLPLTFTTVSGSASTDPDGTIVSYAWTQTAKPSGAPDAVIVSPSSVSTSITNLLFPGVYTFQLTVTDNGTVTNSDTINITQTAQGGLLIQPRYNQIKN